jgi:hypothetical protein
VIDGSALDRAVKTLTMIWGSMAVSVLIYIFVIPRYGRENIKSTVAGRHCRGSKETRDPALTQLN